MKKMIAMILVGVLAISLLACGKKNTKKELQAYAPSHLIIDGTRIGVVQMVAEHPTFSLRGLFLTTGSGQSEYDQVEALETVEYHTSELNAEYELNEWFSVYMQAEMESSLNVYVVRNDDKVNYETLTAKDLERMCFEENGAIAWSVTPDESQYGFLCSLSVSGTGHLTGLYNVFFTQNDVICYLVQLSIVDAAL